MATRRVCVDMWKHRTISECIAWHGHMGDTELSLLAVHDSTLKDQGPQPKTELNGYMAIGIGIGYLLSWILLCGFIHNLQLHCEAHEHSSKRHQCGGTPFCTFMWLLNINFIQSPHSTIILTLSLK